MKLDERGITEQLTVEIWEAKKRGLSGEIMLTIAVNQGQIARASISRARAIQPQPEPRVQRFDGGNAWTS